MSIPLHALAIPALAGVSAFLLSAFLTPIVRVSAVRLGLIARPLEDRWGKRVIARLGGAAMFLGFAAPALLWGRQAPAFSGLLIGSTLVFGLGLLDDLRRMAPYTKLVAQLLIGCVVVLSGVRIELVAWPWLSIPLSVLWFVLIMNAFNLLDNMDGLAAGVGAIAAGFCAVHGALAQQWPAVTLNAILCGTCLGFLCFNFPPAKIYMGDSGSHFLGLSLAALSLLGTWRHSTQLVSVLLIPAAVLAVPIFDTCFVTIQRLLHHQHPFVGGTDHVSHRLAILGLSVRQTVVALYAVSAGLGLLSLLSVNVSPLTTAALWLLVVTGLILLGLYLSNVKVYRLAMHPAPPASVAGGEPVTLIHTMLLHKRRVLEVLVDFCLLSSAYILAYLLRFEGVLSGDLQRLIVQSLPVLLVVKLACFIGCGVYRGVRRYLGLSDILNLLKAVTLGSVLSAFLLLYLWRFEGYSRAVLVIDWMLSFFAVGGSHVLERLLDTWIGTIAAERHVPTLIIGAGDTGARVLRYLKYEERGSRRVIGFLDDDVRKLRMRIHGCPVFGTRARLSEILREHEVREVLVAITDPPGDLLQHVRHCCEPLGVSWKVVTAGVTDAV